MMKIAALFAVTIGTAAAAPTITSQPQAQALADRENAFLSVSATATNPKYQWYRGNSGEVSSPVIGAVGADLVMTPLTETTSLWVRVTDDTGVTDSTPATVTVAPAYPSVLFTSGANSSGQLGTGEVIQETKPVEITQPVIAATGGDSHSLFIRADATLWGVGLNTYGQVGDTAANVGNVIPSPVKIADDVVAVAARSNHSLFIKRDGSLWGMGFNNYSQLGQTGFRPVPRQIFTGVAQVVTGQQHTLILKVDGTVWGMGGNAYGQLGKPNSSIQFNPVQVATGVRQLAAGAFHSLFHKLDGSLWAAGLNKNGQLADGTLVDRSTLVLVGQDVKKIAAGDNHSLLLSSNGSVSGAGANNYRQLGGTDPSNKLVWTPIISNFPISTISAGAEYSLFLRTTGALTALGRNQYGQLGKGNTVTVTSLTQVVTGVVGMGAGSTHSLIIVARPYFTSQPLEVGAILGQTPTLTVAATGKQALSYQWYAGESGDTTQPIGDSNSSGSYTTPPFVTNASYWVRVSGFGGTADSQTIRVKTVTLPVITAQPQGELTGQGVLKTIETIATGEMLTYQWFSGASSDTSSPIAGATLPQYTTPPLQETSSFWVRVTNAAGSAASNTATFPVAPAVLAAMGSTVNGRLGDGTVTDQPLPVAFPTDPVGAGISKIYADSGVVLFLKNDGTLWSQDRYSSPSWLGSQRQPGQTGFIQVASDVAKVSKTSSYTLILKTDGTLWGTGYNFEGILGDVGYSVDTLVPVSTGVTDMVAGGSQCLFVKNDGSLWAVGSNFWGELGDGTTIDRTTPVQVATGVSKVAAESVDSYFLKTDGTLWGMGFWISETRGDLPRQLATDITDITGSDAVPMFFKADRTLWRIGVFGGELYKVSSDVSQASSAGGHTLIVKTDGTLWASGRNYNGELGIGTYVDASVPVQIASDVTLAVATYGYSVFLKNDGTAYAMGSKSEMPFKDNTLWFRDKPYSLGGAVSQVAAGGSHSLFVKADGTLWATGANQSGQIGDDVPGSRITPVLVAENVTKVAAGESHGIFLKSDGTMWGMGSNSDWQLGAYPEGHPIQISTDVREISAGRDFSLFVKSDDTLWGMGSNQDGQLGENPNGETQVGVPVMLATQVKRAAGGDAHTLILKKDGTLWAMGENHYGQCGEGSEFRSPLHQVATDVADMAAGGSHSLFVKNDGTLWAMGYDGYGQLGIGQTTEYRFATPVQVASAVSRVWGGSIHSLFLKTDSTLWGMGYNLNGQLGDVKYHTDLPVKVASGVIDASAGTSHTLFTSVAPVISSPPESVTVASGGNAGFSVTAFGYGPLSYQWFRGTSGDTSQPVAGATDARFTASVPTHAMEYWVRISNDISHEDSRGVISAIEGAGSPGYQLWAVSKNPSDPAPGADPDQDGMNNLTEYAFNTNPSQPSGSQAPIGRINRTFDPPYFEMTLRRRRDADVSISYESSTDLKVWSSSDPIPQVSDSDVDGDGTTELINVYLPLGPTTNGFLRVKITDP